MKEDWKDAMKFHPRKRGYYKYRGPSFLEALIYWDGGMWGYWIGPNWVELATMEGDMWRGMTFKEACDTTRSKKA